jgi:hypothetical protein
MRVRGGARLPYIPSMRMGEYLMYVIAPALQLECTADTVCAKIHTPDLGVVFSAECALRPVGELLGEDAELVVQAWPASDPITRRSLVGNAALY